MKEQEPYFEVIGQYLRGKLSPEAKAEFEARVEAEPALAEELARHEMAFKLGYFQERLEVEGMLEEFAAKIGDEMDEVGENENNGRRIGGRKKSLWILRIAAGLAVLALVGFLLKDVIFPPSLTQMANAHFKIPANVWAVAGPGPAFKGREKYDQGDYEGAIPLLKQADPADASYSGLAFYEGVSWLALAPPSPDSALPAFDRSLSVPSVFRADALWYKALALLFMEDRDGARKTLEEFRAGGAGLLHYETAGDLLRNLD